MTNPKCEHCGATATAAEISAPMDVLDIEFIFATGSIKSRGRECYLRPLLLSVVECLIDAYPHPVSLFAIYEAVYRDRDPEELPNYSVMGVMVTQLRVALAKARMPLAIFSVSNGHDESGLMIAGSLNREPFIRKVA